MNSNHLALELGNADTSLREGTLVLAMLAEVSDGQYRFSIPARDQLVVPFACLCKLNAENLGQTYVLGFDGGDIERPIVLGLLHEIDRSGAAVPVVIESSCEIRLQTGAATIKMTADGTIAIRGQNVATRAAHTNRIRGGNVQIN